MRFPAGAFKNTGQNFEQSHAIQALSIRAMSSVIITKNVSHTAVPPQGRQTGNKGGFKAEHSKFPAEFS